MKIEMFKDSSTRNYELVILTTPGGFAVKDGRKGAGKKKRKRAGNLINVQASSGKFKFKRRKQKIGCNAIKIEILKNSSL